MSYFTISQCVQDGNFINRITACVAQEGGNPTTLPNTLYWTVACASDVEAAYESALIAETPNPGADPTVITDGMILAHVQPLIPTLPA